MGQARSAISAAAVGCSVESSLPAVESEVAADDATLNKFSGRNTRLGEIPIEVWEAELGEASQALQSISAWGGLQVGKIEERGSTSISASVLIEDCLDRVASAGLNDEYLGRNIQRVFMRLGMP